MRLSRPEEHADQNKVHDWAAEQTDKPVEHCEPELDVVSELCIRSSQSILNEPPNMETNEDRKAQVQIPRNDDHLSSLSNLILSYHQNSRPPIFFWVGIAK